jgi:hypothetical protein
VRVCVWWGDGGWVGGGCAGAVAVGIPLSVHVC